MFRTLRNKLGLDNDYPDPQRVQRLLAYQQVLDGTIYDSLPFDFHQERDADRYVPLRERAPSVRFNLCRTVVQDSVSLLFGEGRFPTLLGETPDARGQLEAFIEAADLVSVMTAAAMTGAVGAVALRFRVMNQRPFFDPLRTTYLTPTWDPEEPDRLIAVQERYKVRGRDLARMGYDIEEQLLGSMHWFQRSWDEATEGWYIPVPVNRAGDGDTPMRLDAERTVRHDLGFVPFVWVRNLPPFEGNDGQCTFAPAIDTQIEIEYQLSQAGRGLKYSSDPMLVIKEPAAPDEGIVKGAGNALVLSENGDAKLLEIGGTAAAAVVEYVRALRELALESVHGHRASADKVSAAQSGRALELSFQGLVWLADKLRVSYGSALVQAVELARQAAGTGRLRMKDRNGAALPLPDGPIDLRWPPFFPPTHQDRQSEATALTTLIHDEVISRETSTELIAATYDIADVQAERKKVEAERADQMKRAQQMAAQVQLKETGEA